MQESKCRQVRATILMATMCSTLCVGLIGCDRGNAPPRKGPTEPTDPPVQRSLQIVALTPTAISGVVGSVVTPTPAARIIDNLGAPVAGVLVTFELMSGQALIDGASVNSNADGVAGLGRLTLGTLVGMSVIRAGVSGSGMNPIEFTATARAGDPAELVRTGGDAQRGLVGETLPNPLSVKVTDTFGNPVGGVDVAFSVLSGGGAIRSPATTNDGGVANGGLWTLGPVPAQQRIVATAGTARVEFSALAYERCAAVCVDTGAFAFVRENDIYRMNVDGTGLVQLTTGGVSAEPTWSPDGRRIAFSRHNGVSDDVYLIDSDGGDLKLFASSAESPSWSPDGRQIAYAGRYGDAWRILVRAVDDPGKPPIAIGFDRGQNRFPAWSPDGGRIAFVSDWEAFDFAMEVYVVKPDGSDVKQLTAGFFGNVASWPTYMVYQQPAWSPDGRQLAIVSCQEWQFTSCRQSNVAVMGADGSGVRTLVATLGFARPLWMPDGSIVFSRVCLSNDSCVPNTFILSADGGPERLLIANGHSAALRP